MNKIQKSVVLVVLSVVALSSVAQSWAGGGSSTLAGSGNKGLVLHFLQQSAVSKVKLSPPVQVFSGSARSAQVYPNLVATPPSFGSIDPIHQDSLEDLADWEFLAEAIAEIAAEERSLVVQASLPTHFSASSASSGIAQIASLKPPKTFHEHQRHAVALERAMLKLLRSKVINMDPLNLNILQPRDESLCH